MSALVATIRNDPASYITEDWVDRLVSLFYESPRVLASRGCRIAGIQAPLARRPEVNAPGSLEPDFGFDFRFFRTRNSFCVMEVYANPTGGGMFRCFLPMFEAELLRRGETRLGFINVLMPELFGRHLERCGYVSTFAKTGDCDYWKELR